MAELLTFPASSASQANIPEASVELSSASRSSYDVLAREEALDAQRSFVVEAPAGSGKTGLLMQRFLHLLGSVAEPEEVLAITFTRKATAELRDRVLQQLEAAAAQAPLAAPETPFARKTRELALSALARDRERGWRLLGEPRRLRVQTIDALCIEIAGSLPLLSAAASRRPTENASELYREAARNTLLQLGGPDRILDEALHAVLLHRDGNLADVEALLAGMMQTREQWAELLPLDHAAMSDQALDEQVRPKLERALEQVVCAGLTRALRLMPSSALTELAALAHRYAGEPGYQGRPSPILLCREYPGSPRDEAAHLDHWRALLSLLLTKEHEWRKSFAVNAIQLTLEKEDRERLKELVVEIQSEPLREALEGVRCLPPARYPDEQWVQAKALFRLLLHSLAQLKLLFAERGECDFTEFSLAARQALAERPEDFARNSGVTLRHLLVDEMQDTSSAQYDLLTALTRFWDGSSQTVFLVGDPKQSIYLFRQARVERFLRTAAEKRLGDVPLVPLQLTANFRSRPAVVEGVNGDFTHLFQSVDEPSGSADNVRFVTAEATRGPAPGGVYWHTRVERTQREDGGLPEEPSQPAPDDAAAIRVVVEQWRSKPLPPDRQARPGQAEKPWRIAVLANARTHLAAVASELGRTDNGREPIPYRAVKVEALQDRPEVLDALALARALHHPADRTAWFAVLRAPWCGLSAADLLALAGEGEPEARKATVLQLVAARLHLLSDEGQRLLRRVLPILQAALKWSAFNPYIEIVRRTWITLGGQDVVTADERANVERFFSLIASEDTAGGLDFRRLKERMKELYAETPDIPGSVELLTIHGAKGLEWDVVLVPGLGRPGQRDPNRLLNWLELEAGHDPVVLLAPIHGKGDEPSRLYEWLNAAHCARVEAERKRVFYVACTRAREELHLFAAAREVGKDRRLSAPSGSLLHACWPAAERHFQQADTSLQRIDVQVTTVPLRTDAASAGPALALAASVDTEHPAVPAAQQYLPRITRLPPGFDPAQRFAEANVRRLPYTRAEDRPASKPVDRPEGSLVTRALGNVVHRFLEQLARRLADGSDSATLVAELPMWVTRLTASLRSEGLAPADAIREAARAHELLAQTLADHDGLWLLSPHSGAQSEQALATRDAGLLRVDRTFRAGAQPGEPGEGTLWIVDYKTAQPGGRTLPEFLAAQRDVYGPQLQRYANALRAEPANSGVDVRLGLYFPAVPRLLHWPAEP